MMSKKTYKIKVADLTTWSKADVIEKIFTPITDNKKKSKEILLSFLNLMTDRISKKIPIMLPHVGNLSVNYKNERPGRNPKNGVDALITSRYVVTLSKCDVKIRSKGSELISITTEEVDGVTEKSVRDCFYALCHLIDDVSKGDYRIEFRGFGIFSPVFRAKKKGRNPKTGEKVDVEASIVVHFKQSRYIIGLLNPDLAEKNAKKLLENKESKESKKLAKNK